MNIDIWDMSPEEQLYADKQSPQVRGQAGCIGYLQIDLDKGDSELKTVWETHCDWLNTYEFGKELNKLIETLRFDDEYEGILKDRKALGQYCENHPGCMLQDGKGYGIRVDSREYSYMCRLYPDRGVNNFCLYAYKKEYLDKQMKDASKGIRFIDSKYNENFRIPDGGTVRITYPTYSVQCKCRYIDDYHVEVGKRGFHSCEFAEMLENQNATVEPVTPPIEKNKQKEKTYAGIDR